jgi:hypothetical protein
LKGLLAKQAEENAEANKNLPELQKKLQETIKIHDPKPPRKDFANPEGGEEGAVVEDDKEFDKVEEKKRGERSENPKRGGGFRGGRGRGYHREGEEGKEKEEGVEGGEHPHPKKHFDKGERKGGFNKDDGEHDKKDKKPKKAVPVVQEKPVANVPETKFEGWGGHSFF